MATAPTWDSVYERNSVERIKRDKPPFIRQKSLDTFSVQYELNVHCDDPLKMRTLFTDLHRNVLDVFNEYGVQIMTPAYEGDPEVPKVVPQDKWFDTPARAPGTQNMKVAKAIAPP